MKLINAAAGIYHAYLGKRLIRIYFAAATFLIFLAGILRIQTGGFLDFFGQEYWYWPIIFTLAGLVIGIGMLDASIKGIGNAFPPAHPSISESKNFSSGAVLFCAIATAAAFILGSSGHISDFNSRALWFNVSETPFFWICGLLLLASIIGIFQPLINPSPAGEKSCAPQGIRRAALEERSVRVYFAAVFFTFIFAWLSLASFTEWAILAIICGLVVGVGLLHASLKKICSEISSDPEKASSSEKINEISSGAVLVCVIFAIVAGFLWSNIHNWEQFINSPVFWVGVGALPASVVLIALPAKNPWRFGKKFIGACIGIYRSALAERSVRIHFAAVFYVLITAEILRIQFIDWAVLVALCGLVLGAELINTAIERVCDAIEPEKSLAIKKIKDIAAGAVLICVLAAIAAGIFNTAYFINAYISIDGWQVLSETPLFWFGVAALPVFGTLIALPVKKQ